MAAEATILPEIVENVSMAAGLLSLAAMISLGYKSIRGRPLLQYQPRRRVPWKSGVALLAMGMPLLGILSFLFGAEEPSTDNSKPMPVQSLLISGWVSFAFMMLFVAGVSASLVSFCHANARDLGLPSSVRQLALDIGIGLTAVAERCCPSISSSMCSLTRST